MTTGEALARIEKIKAEKSDSETAHMEEDSLREDVLRAIAAGATNARELAAVALSTGAIDFVRWYA